MKVASHQPAFLPWVGLWHKIASVDHFIISAGTKYTKDAFLNRQRLNGAWLTLPVSAPEGTPITQVRLAQDGRAILKVQKTLAQHVSGPYRSRLQPLLSRMESVEAGDRLYELNVGLMSDIASALKLKPIDWHVDTTEQEYGANTAERLAHRIERNVPDATSYYGGSGSQGYINDPAFKLPVFLQVHSGRYSGGFDPELNIVQLIAREPDPLDWIMSRGSWYPSEPVKEDNNG